MRRNQTENRPVIFLDETWANAHDGKVCAWAESDMVTGGTLGGVKCRYVRYSYTTSYVKLLFLKGGPQVKVHGSSFLEQAMRVVGFPTPPLYFAPKKFRRLPRQDDWRAF